MSDIGMSQDSASIAEALSLARKSMGLLCVSGTTVLRPTDEVQIYILEEASFHFHQLSALLDLLIQERAAAARPQEEANEHTGGSEQTDPELADGVGERQEGVDGSGGPPVR